MKHATQPLARYEQAATSDRKTSNGLLVVGILFGLCAAYEAVMTVIVAAAGSRDEWLIHFVPAGITAGLATACVLLALSSVAPPPKE